MFGCIKVWRRVFTRYNKLNMMFVTFTVVLIAEALR